MSGEPLNTSNVEESAYQVAYLEDMVLINGYSSDGTEYEVEGLYEAAGNEDAGAYWADPDNIPISIQTAIAALLEDNIQPPYNLCVNPTNWMEAFVFIGTTAVTYQMWLKEAMQGGDIFVTPAMPVGQCTVSVANPEGKFEYVLAEDLTTQLETTSIKEGENLFGRNYLRGLPIVYDPNAICRLTTITEPEEPLP